MSLWNLIWAAPFVALVVYLIVYFLIDVLPCKNEKTAQKCALLRGEGGNLPS